MAISKTIADEGTLASATVGNFLCGRKVAASYHTPDQVHYRHNPYIEALPPLMGYEEIVKRISRLPAYDPGDRRKPALIRQDAVQVLDHLIVPLTTHLDLAQRFSRMIQNGYFARNPIEAEWVRQMRAGFPGLYWGEENEYAPTVRSNVSGFAIIGASGAGKTTGVDSCLQLYPQIIRHTQFNGQPFDQTQVVWLKLECPFDGSPKGLCINFFQTINQLLGKEKQSQSYARLSVDMLLADMAHLAANLGLGVLVIDEIQRLNEAKSGGSQRMLNFFVELQNSIGVPVVLVGTFKAMHLMQGTFSQARRAAGQGDLVWHNMAKDDEWDHFLKLLWRYQWTKQETPLDDLLSQALYEESQGIIDIAVKLYKLVQWDLIDDDNTDERIAPALIHQAARDHLILARPILQALKRQDYTFLSRIDDIHPLTRDLNNYFDTARTEVSRNEALEALKKQHTNADFEAHSPDGRFAQIIQMLKQAGIDELIAASCTEKARKQCGDTAPLAEVLQVALALAVLDKTAADDRKVVKDNPTSKTTRHRTDSKHLQSGMEAIVSQGAGKKKSAHESLVDAGMVDLLDEYLE